MNTSITGSKTQTQSREGERPTQKDSLPEELSGSIPNEGDVVTAEGRGDIGADDADPNADPDAGPDADPDADSGMNEAAGDANDALAPGVAPEAPETVGR